MSRDFTALWDEGHFTPASLEEWNCQIWETRSEHSFVATDKVVIPSQAGAYSSVEVRLPPVGY